MPPVRAIVTGPSRPRLCLGTVQFGMAYGIGGRSDAFSDDEARQILEAAHAAGIRRLDTAPAYGNIEERLGRLCDGLDFEIVSKIPALPRGFGRTEAEAFIAASLDISRWRLGDKLRGVLFHGPEDLNGDMGTALWDAAAGWCAVHAIPLGSSSYSPKETATLAERYAISIAQLPGNAFDQRLNAFPDAFDAIEITVRSIFLQGLLLMNHCAAATRLPAAAAAIERWHRWCADHGLAPLHAAIAAAKALPGVDYCTVGVDDVGQLAAIAAAWDETSPLSDSGLAIDDPAIIDPRKWKVTS